MTKSIEKVNVMVMIKKKCREESFVGVVQLYSDEFVTYLKQTGVSAYTIHINLMNFLFDAWKNKL